MGFGVKLGHRMVRIWRWITGSRKVGCYARLHHENRRKCVRLRIGRKIWGRSTNSQGLSYNFCDSPQGIQAGLVRSPQYSKDRSWRQFHLPHPDFQSLKFRHWHLPFHFHISHGYKKGLQYYEGESSNHVPKGFLVVYVGQGEEIQRFEIPVPYFNHPLFGELLKEAEDEYGFDQRGAINIPCELSQFEKVQSLISHSSPKHKHP